MSNFYPRPPRGGRPCPSPSGFRGTLFLSTPSARRATPMQEPPGQSLENFYPRPPRGGRLPPCRQCHWRVDFYPRPPRGGRHGEWWDSWDSGAISIHALREEGDLAGSFSSLWARYFYPRPPRGGRLSYLAEYFYHLLISIHALREEGDPPVPVFRLLRLLFLSTPSARRATPITKPCSSKLFVFLSTPSARRATSGVRPDSAVPRYFYPRPPRGGRQQKQRQNLYFQTNYTTFCTNLEEL